MDGEHCPVSPSDSQNSCDQIPVGDIIGGSDVVVVNNSNNNHKRKNSPLNHEDTDGDALSPRKQMHHGNTTNNNDVTFVLMDDDGGGPGDDLGSDDVVDPDDVQDMTEVSGRERLWAFECSTRWHKYFVNNKALTAICSGGLMWTVSSDMIELQNGL